MNIFSFCIYGQDMKYYLGLEENARIINEYYPDYHIYIYYGTNCNKPFLDGLLKEYTNVSLFETGKDGAVNMIYRYSPLILDGLERVIVRDADSEINERDRWCINDFIHLKDDSRLCQVIRDHYWHKSRITGGLSHFRVKGLIYEKIKEEFLTIFREIDEGVHCFQYGSDENVLNHRISPILQEYVLVYSNICVYEGETVRSIDFVNDGTNFCGNVVDYILLSSETESCGYIKRHKFNYYNYNFLYQIEWLHNQKQYDLIIKVFNEHGLHRIEPNIVSHVLYHLLTAYIYKRDIQKCLEIYSMFYKYSIMDSIKNTSSLFFEMVKTCGYSVVGTCDVNYTPKETEFVIYFGNYPDDYMGLPQSYQIYRHFIFKDVIPLDRFESAECWNSIDRIFIMGLENEFERMNDTIMHLTIMNAPLNRIEEYIAKKDLELTDIYIGATKNHLDCLKKMMDGNYETCLFLEDDFVFTSNIRENQKSLSTFFERNYDYNICFLSASKHHLRDDFDDLLILSKQICTTSSGYLVNRKNIELVYETVKEGYNCLLENKEQSSIYCIDRYWTKLDKLFIFKRKIGFQKPSKSKITGKLNIELD
jgi:hypothetical protein